MLERLERGNLFVVAIDERREWYRYHHLFADCLRVRTPPGPVHDVASRWFEQHGFFEDAIAHALAAEDHERAGRLIELALPEIRRTRREATLFGWLKALPDEEVRRRPVLTVYFGFMLMVSGDLEGAAARLDDAEPRVQTNQLAATIAMYRASLAQARGDTAATTAYARRTLELAGPDDHLGRGAAAGLLGLAYWTGGDLDAGYRWYAEAAGSLQQAGHLSDVTGCSIALADIRITQGRLGEALRTCEGALQLVTPGTGPVLRGAADMHVGIAGVLLERGDLEAARRHLATSSGLGEHAGLPQNPYRWRVAMARLREAEGDPDGALALLDEAQRRYVADYFPDVRPVPALRARVHARQGRWADALAWAEERGLSVGDDPDHLREFEHLTLARALVARDAAGGGQGSMPGAVQLLERLLHAAEDGGRTGSVLDVLVVQALAQQTRGDRPAALAALRRALALAEAQGHVRLLLDEGPPMAALLRAAAAEGSTAGYARRLLAALETCGGSAPVPGSLIDPLSVRELEVLRLLGSDLDGPDIARRLFVSVNTVRTHTKNIYAKLGVTNRRAAVRRGAELDLLARDGDRRPARTVIADR
jgi:LuxR family maltose regulon positive regulatory protein